MKSRLAVPVLGMLLVMALIVVPGTTAAAQSPTKLAVPVTGILTGGGLGTGTLNGILNITNILQQGGQLVAIGTLTGTLTNTLGTVLGTVNQVVALPITLSGGCLLPQAGIGPINLSIQGVTISISPTGPIGSLTSLVDSLLGTVTGLVNSLGCGLTGLLPGL